MRKSPLSEDETNSRQTPKSLCRTSLVRSNQISQIIQKNQNFTLDNAELSDKVSSDNFSSDTNDNEIIESNFKFSQEMHVKKSPSPHFSSLKRSPNHPNLENSNFSSYTNDNEIIESNFKLNQEMHVKKSPSPHFSSLKRSPNHQSIENPILLKQISHPLDFDSYHSLKRKNEITITNEDCIKSNNFMREALYNQIYSKSIIKKSIQQPIHPEINSEDNDSISNDGSSSDPFEASNFQHTQEEKNDPIQTDDFFFSQDTNNYKNASDTDQVVTEDIDDKIDNEINHETEKNSYDDDVIEEASQNFYYQNSNSQPFLQSDDISKDESDDLFESDEEIDSTVHSQFFKQQKVVFEYINEENDELDTWNFEYMRIIYAKTVDSQIDELNEESYRVLVRRCDTSHVKKQGDNFVLGTPYYAYAHLGKIYLIAPNVSDKM